jgi:hypothetical protein
LSIEQTAFSNIQSNSPQQSPPQQSQLITTQSLEEVSNTPQLLVNEHDSFIDDDNDDYIEEAEESSIHSNSPLVAEVLKS